MRFVLVALAAAIALACPVRADDVEALTAFKARALDAFARQAMEDGDGRIAVGLALEAVKAAEGVPETGRDATLTLAHVFSTNIEFATLTADDFELDAVVNPWGMFLPGARHFVAFADGAGTTRALLADARTGKVLDREAVPFDLAAVASSRDGRVLFLLDADRSGGAVWEVGDGIVEPVRDVTFADDEAFGAYYLDDHGGKLARIDLDGAIVILDVATGEEAGPPDEPVAFGPARIAGSDSLSRVVLSAALDEQLDLLEDYAVLPDGRVFEPQWGRILDPATGDVQTFEPQVDRGRVRIVAVSPDGRLVLGRAGLEIGVWRLSDGERVLAVSDRRDGEYPFGFSLDGRQILTFGWGTFWTRAIEDGEIIGQIDFGETPGPRPDPQVSPDGAVIAIEDGSRIRFAEAVFQSRPVASAVSADGAGIAAAYRDDQGSFLRLIAPDGAGIATAVVGETIRRVFLGPGDLVAAVTDDGSFLYWPQGLDGRRFTLSVPPFDTAYYPLHSLPVLLGGDFVAIGGWRGPRGLWDLTDGTLRSALTHADGSIEGFAIDGSGTRFAAITQNGDVTVYDTRDGAFLTHYRDSGRADVDTGGYMVGAALFTPDGSEVEIFGGNGWRRRLNVETASVKRLADDDEWISAVALRDDGMIAVGNRPVRLLSPDGASMPLEMAAAGDGSEFGAGSRAFSPDGERLAAVVSQGAGTPARLLVWTVDDREVALEYALPLIHDRMGVDVDVRFSPDGAWVVVTQTDGRFARYPATVDGLVETATNRIGPLKPAERCAWFLCE